MRRTLTPDDPRHGKYAGYVAHRFQEIPLCGPCREAKQAYQRAAYRRATVVPRRYEPTLLRKHLLRLLDSGMSRADIANTAGLSHETVQRIIDGRLTYVLRRTAVAIAALEPGTPGLCYRPSRGARRRLQALIAMGWPAKLIAEETQMSTSRLSMFLHGTSATDKVRIETWDLILDVYGRRAMKPGPSKLSRTLARKNGWAPPLAWDDIDKDDAPTGMTARLGNRWGVNKADRLAELRSLERQGVSIERAAEALGISQAALWKWCAANGAGDLYERISARTRTASNGHIAKAV